MLAQNMHFQFGLNLVMIMNSGTYIKIDMHIYSHQNWQRVVTFNHSSCVMPLPVDYLLNNLHRQTIMDNLSCASLSKFISKTICMLFILN